MPEQTENLVGQEDVEAERVARGRELVRQLFDVLKVKRVVVVDDDYEIGVADQWFTDVLEALQEQYGDEALAAVGISDAAGEHWYGALQEKLDRWGASDRLEQARRLRDRYPEVTAAFRYFSDRLAALIENDRELFQLSPTEWSHQRDHLIAEADAAERRKQDRTVFLFDLDLAEKDPRGFNGRQLLDLLRTDSRQPSLLCGILTGKFGKEQEEEAAGAGLNPPVYVSKERLHQEPETFAFRVRETAMSEVVGDVISTAIEILKSAHTTAEQGIQKLGIHSLERLILQISQQEGIWEADTIFRIFGIYQRKAAREKARADGRLDEALESMRTLGGIGSGPTPDAKPLELKRIQALEMYEDSADLNRHFLPIELGDIFEIRNEDTVTHYILLGQPCDLSLRPPRRDGEQSSRKIVAPWLAKLVSYGKGGPDKRSLPSLYELPYFQDDLASMWVDFRMAIPVSLDPLDLCAFNITGRAELDVTNPPPPGLLRGWELRFQELKGKYQRELERRRLVLEFIREGEQTNRVPDIIREQLLATPDMSFGVVGIPSFDRSCVRFGCRRVRRLRQPWAGVLLIKFGHHISREAFEVDLGRGD